MKRVLIIGGAKTAANLYRYLLRLQMEVELYYFPEEYLSKKNIGAPFLENKKSIEWNSYTAIFITSETAFHALPVSQRHLFSNHYYLRDKRNLVEVAKRVGVSSILDVDISTDFNFPIIIKPQEASTKQVSFKFRILRNKDDWKKVAHLAESCLIQPYLDEKFYRQIAVAGYFDGQVSSLIAVEQLEQYPVGISAYVSNKTDEYSTLLNQVADYLKDVGFTGFIELELKQHRITQALYLMDINPRTWGWFYFYLDGMLNFRYVIESKKPVELILRKAWVNLPRLFMANLKKPLKIPKIKWFVTNAIAYEPYF